MTTPRQILAQISRLVQADDDFLSPVQKAVRALPDDDLLAACRWARLRAAAIRDAMTLAELMGPPPATAATGFEHLTDAQLMAALDDATDLVIEERLAEARERSNRLDNLPDAEATA